MSDEHEIPRISWLGWIVILAISLPAGFFLHWVITAGVYRAASAAAEQAPANFARNWGDVADGPDSTGKPPEKQLPAADLMLRYMGLAKDSVDGDLSNRLSSAYKPSMTGDGKWVPPERTPALVVAARLLGSGQSSECDDKVIRYVASALSRQLVGWPGDTKSELASIKQFRQARLDSAGIVKPPDGGAAKVAAQGGEAKAEDSVRKSIAQACNKFADTSAPAVGTFGPTFSRTSPKSADDLAELILGADSCLPGAAASKDFTECRLVKALFVGTLNADSVRSARLDINFFWGWERAAVAVLAFLVLLAMGYLWLLRRPLEQQEERLRVWLAEADGRLSPHKPGHRIKHAEGEAKDMQQRFHCEWKGGLTVLRDLIDATQESMQTEHREHLKSLVELHTQALGRQRAFINALITAFPAIGLVATLDGLIIALSRASGIVAGTEAERFASTEQVTAVLSSSFATTMLALIAMAICMLINVREEHREADLLENTHKRLIAVFWPGRPSNAAPTPAPAPVSSSGSRQ